MTFDKARFRTYFQAHAQGKAVRLLARDIGISASTVSRVANGETPDLDSFAAIVAWMGVSADEFFSKEPIEKQDYDARLMRLGYALYDTDLPESLNEAILAIIRLIKKEEMNNGL